MDRKVSSKKAQEEYKELSDQIRKKNRVQWRTAVNATLQERVEFFRGKDFTRYFQQHQDDIPSISKKGNNSLEQQIEYLGNQLIQYKLLMKCERKYTKPKPGKKGLVKFPRTIIQCQDQSWDENYLYCWLYERPTSMWNYVWSALLVLGVLAICLYPLAPYSIKVGVAYTSMGLLILIFSLILIRFFLFGSIWIISGYQLWILPNLFSEQAVTLEESVYPIYSFDKPDKLGNEIYSRAIALGAVAVTIWLLYFYTPNTDILRNQAQSAHDKMLELLQQKNPFSLLSGEAFNNTNQDIFNQQTSQQTR